MNRSLIFTAMLLCSLRGAAQPAAAPVMKISMDKEVFLPGDSIHWQCSLNGFGHRFNAVTMQLWIESLSTGMRWQYRFPVINSYSEGAIVVDKTIPAGQYAFNYILQADFFNIKGRLSMPLARDTVLNYVALFRNKETILNTVPVSPGGNFALRGLVFQDTAMFSFSRTGRKDDPPFISIETSLDSAVMPVVPVVTRFVHIVGDGEKADTGNAGSVLAKDYVFHKEMPAGHQLENVVIEDRRINKQLKDYEQAYVSPAFRAIDDITLDGLSNDDMLRAGDLYTYLSMHVPGLTYETDPENGARQIKWRGGTPSIYIDEFKLPEGTPVTIMPSEVAMIKVFRPGNGPLVGGSNNAGAVAIYTKMGRFQGPGDSAAPHNRFYVRGYSARELLWSY